MTDRIGISYPTPNTSFWLAADHIASDNANGRWLVRFYLRAGNGPGGSSGSQYNGPGVQVGYYNGNEFGRHSGNPFLPAGYPDGAQRWNDGPWDVWVNGRTAWNMPLSMLLQYGSVNHTTTGSIPLPTLATAPAKPAAPTASSVTTTSMRLSWKIPSNGGAAIDQMLLRRSSKPDMSAYTDYPQAANATTAVVNGLTPGTPYYWAVFAHNPVGYSARSGILTQATLPSGPPGLTITPNVTGTAVVAKMTPPGGVSGVNRYRIESEATATGVVTAKTVDATDENPYDFTGLTPGGVYRWRARAEFTGYNSVFSDWITVTQPNPNTNAGSFFDGNTADTLTLDYGWTGTVNNSTSVARGRIPTGWKTFAAAAAASGGTGAVFQAAGGVQGASAARAVFFTDSTAYGFAFGTADSPTSMLADVEPNALYFGSLHVWPSKQQRMREVTLWWDAAGAFISSSYGDEVVVSPGGYTRLSGSGTAPPNAQWASVNVQTVAGTGASLLLSGDWVQVDAAMVTLQALYGYFDGSTPDTPVFQYEWVGSAHMSPSRRLQSVIAESDPLADPDCPPVPGAPRPPQIDTSCIDSVGTWRRYWVVIPESEVFDWLAVVPTLTIATGGFAARQVRVRFYPNPDGVPPATTLDLPVESEQIISYMPANTVFTLDGVSESAWASVNGADDVPADHLLYGANGEPATWPVLSCGDAYLISIDVPLDAPEGNIVAGASLTTRMM